MAENSTINTFLSWSGTTSLAVAKAFQEFLPHIVQGSVVFFSPDDIRKDQEWFGAVQNGLSAAKTGIVFLTNDNKAKEWILLEAGALLAKGRLCVLLCDLSIKELTDNKSVFQYLNVTELHDETSLARLFLAISDAVSPPTVKKEVITRAFKNNIKELQARITENSHGSDNASKAKSKFSKYARKWRLEGFGEEPRIDQDGKYWLYFANEGREVFYFQLEIVSEEGNKITWNKFQTIGEEASQYLHSTEVLQFDNDHLIGKDITYGYDLIYKPV